MLGSSASNGIEAHDELPALQYTLHASAELALGLDPPARVGPLHAELVDALAQARDATAEVAEAVDEGDDELVARLLPEWRGALFRVRLARLRALERSPLRLPADEPARTAGDRGEVTLSATALVATGLVVVGALLFTAGAVLAAWPLWAAVRSLYVFVNSTMLMPCGPSAVPTGGAGVALPAGSCSVSTIRIFLATVGSLSRVSRPAGSRARPWSRGRRC